MKVLVLGGTRFIGRAIVDHLLRDGHEVTLLNRGFASDPFGTRVRRIVGDRRDNASLERAARRDLDAVIDVTAYHESETETVIRHFRDSVGHLIHISTAAVYLIREGLFPPYAEHHAVGPLTSPEPGDPSSWRYARHKRCCEELLEAAWNEARFPFTAFRLPMVIGPHDYTRRSDAYLERLAGDGPLILPDGGLNSWGFLWVEDVAKVVVENLANSLSFGRVYNLAQREAVTLRQLIDLAKSMLGSKSETLCLPSQWLHSVGLGTGFSPYTHDGDILLECHAAEEDLLFAPTPFPRSVELLVRDFRSRWNGRFEAFGSTRSSELRLASELRKVRMPSFAPAASSG